MASKSKATSDPKPAAKTTKAAETKASKTTAKSKATKAPAAKAAKDAKAPAPKLKLMTKEQLVGHFATKFNVTRKNAQEMLDELSNLIVTEIKNSGGFVLPNVGKFLKAIRSERMGINPQNRQKKLIPAKTVVKFRVAKACLDGVTN